MKSHAYRFRSERDFYQHAVRYSAYLRYYISLLLLLRYIRDCVYVILLNLA